MGKLSIVAENLWLDHILGVATFTPTADTYLALSTVDFLEDGSGAAEPVANGYARTITSTLFGTAAAGVGRIISNDALITCPTASGAGWGTITHWAIFDHITAGRLLAFGAIAVGKLVSAGQTPKVAVGEIDISVPTNTTYGMTTFLADEMLDMTFLDTNPAYTPAGLFMGLATGNLNDAGSMANECAYTGSYVKLDVDTLWDAAAASVTANDTALLFALATGAWGTVSDYFFGTVAAEDGGDMLLYGTFDASSPIIADDQVNIPIGDLDITMSEV
jgi:hypothetical protein